MCKSKQNLKIYWQYICTLYVVLHCTGTELTYWWPGMDRSCSCCAASSEYWQLRWGRCSYCYCAHTPASPRQGPETRIILLSLSDLQFVLLEKMFYEELSSLKQYPKYSVQSTVEGEVAEKSVLIIPSGRQCPLMGRIWHIHLWKCWGSAGGCWWELWPQTQWGWQGASSKYSEKSQNTDRTLSVNHTLQIKQIFISREVVHLCK